MKNKKERFEILFENNPHPTWVYDVETLRFLEVNRAAVRHYGYSREEFLAMRITDIRPPGDVSALLEELKKERPDVQSSERRYLTKDGWVIPVAVTSNLAELHGRKVVVVVAEDITARKQAQEILIRSKEDAERATQFKDQFLSTMSHELRTPLNSILGFSELLSDEGYGPLNQRQRRYVDHIHKSGQHLLRLINDILDLSRIEAGRFELDLETVSISSIFDEVVSTMKPLAERKSQSLVHSADDQLEVRADATRLKQILLNLIGNAIKFTPERGRVGLVATTTDGQLRIEIHDTGPGIPFEEQTRIFEAFYRLRTPGEAIEGTGLGLAITQRLVQLHGSELGISSEVGKGTCFYFLLPALTATKTETTGKGPLADGSRDSPRILVVEVEPVAARTIESQLTSSGYTVVPCTEARRVHEMALALQPDAITLAVLMRPTNGWEVLLELKSDPRTAGIPVIVLTLVDQPGMGAILGADEYLVKPVQKETLLNAVERCIRSRSAAPAGQHILVVEDHAPTLEMISELLRSRGYEVQTAADGQQARTSVAASIPALVILDLLLPVVGGFELIAEWRADQRTSDLPIFVLTSKDLSLDETKFLRANAEFSMQKQQEWQEVLLRQLQRATPRQQVEAT
jgi:PAS domain S-box-containing protein